MAGPSLHGQRNKKHKAGRQAGASARDKHKSKKEGRLHGRDATAQAATRKADRLANVKSARDKKRAEALERRRRQPAPQVVGLLPLSTDLDTQTVWDSILRAASQGSLQHSAGKATGSKSDAMEVEVADKGSFPLLMRTVTLPTCKTRATFLPPPNDMKDPLCLVEFLKAVDVLILAMPGAKTLQVVDNDGRLALELLTELGVTSCIGLVHSATDGSMKARSATRKAGEAALSAHFAGQHRMLNFDNPEDCKQLFRFLDEHTPTLPTWRQRRPSLMVEAAELLPPPAPAAGGVLVLTGYIRCAGMSANQNIHIPGAGDFQIEKIEGLHDGRASATRPTAGGDAGMGDEGFMGPPTMLALPDPSARDTLDRENVPNPLEGEQTWPTEEELMEAESAAAAQRPKRRLPKGTSAYQAAWIPDLGEVEEDDGGEDGDDDAMHGGSEGEEDEEEEEEVELEEEMESDGMTVADEEESAAQRKAMMASLKQQRAVEDDEFPDEVDTPMDIEARTRFGKYRGLKSFRTSPWDPKESLPQEYARVFAFENFTRAFKRAAEAQRQAGDLSDPHGVESGVLARVHVSGMDKATSAAVLQRVGEATQGGRPPLVAVGLMQHECKLSVAHFLVKKVKDYEEPVANKEELLICNGVRAFMARPILSQNSRADKHKMERYLRPGEHVVASCYAPIAYPQLPVLMFKLGDPSAPFGPARRTRLVAVGSLHSCNPDRVILKKIVLSGFPVRVHKKKAVVKYMFFNPDDVKWFKPLELWTKYGRRGRIKEPVGDHGTMKCIFDGPVQQRDSVCISLYKRAFPKWPQSMTFA